MKNKKELIFILSIILIAGAIFLYSSITKETGSVAQVLVSNKVVKELPLSEDTIYVVEDVDGVIVEVKDNKVRIKESDCKDQICVHQGYISGTHEKIVCLPNEVMVTIDGAGADIDDELDGVL